MIIQRREITRLVNSVDGELRANSRIIAGLLKVEHKNFVALVERNLKHFNEFGAVRFETRPRIDGNVGGDQPKDYLLTEDQCYFALTLVRNTSQSIELKKRLVHEFSEARGNPRYQSEKKIENLKRQIFILENEPLTLLGFQQLSLKERKAQRSQIWEIWKNVGATKPSLNYRRIQVAKRVNLIVNGMSSYAFKRRTQAVGLARDWMPLENQYCFYLAEFDLLNQLRQRNFAVSFEFIESLYSRLAYAAKARVEALCEVSLEINIEEEVNNVLRLVREQVEFQTTPYTQIEEQLLFCNNVLVDESKRFSSLL